MDSLTSKSGVSELPKQLCLKAPIPSRRPYNGSHCKFLREVHQGIESGEEILFVEARLQKWSPSLRCSPTIQLSWGIHILVLYEELPIASLEFE
jgi:hypothetical protein